MTINLSEHQGNFPLYVGGIVLCSVYIINIIYAAYNKHNHLQSLLKYTICFDIPLISFIVYIRGGVRSDTYLFYYFVILYEGAKFGYKRTTVSLVQSIIYFSAAAAGAYENFELNRYIIRVIYLITFTFVVYEVNKLIHDSLLKEKQAKALAYIDPLTQLPNRLLMSEHFERLRKLYNKGEQAFAIVMIDIDNFKKINDSKGHAFGLSSP